MSRSAIRLVVPHEQRVVGQHHALARPQLGHEHADACDEWQGMIGFPVATVLAITANPLATTPAVQRAAESFASAAIGRSFAIARASASFGAASRTTSRSGRYQ